MAKSAQLHELDEQGRKAKGSITTHFWEHWFQGPKASQSSTREQEEHSIWERAIHFGIFPIEKAKG